MPFKQIRLVERDFFYFQRTQVLLQLGEVLRLCHGPHWCLEVFLKCDYFGNNNLWFGSAEPCAQSGGSSWTYFVNLCGSKSSLYNSWFTNLAFPDFPMIKDPFFKSPRHFFSPNITHARPPLIRCGSKTSHILIGSQLVVPVWPLFQY